MKNISSAAKRVALAKDVLKWLNEGIIFAHSGGIMYAALENEIEKTSNWNAAKRDSLLTLLQSRKVECGVCAKGAFLIAKLVKIDQPLIIEGDQNPLHAERATLKAIPEMPPKMMAELEMLFENDSYSWDRDHLSQSEQNQLLRIAETLPIDENKRLELLCKKLIANKGVKIFL